MLALPCRRRYGRVDCGDEGAEGALATGLEEPCLASSVGVREGGARCMSAMELVAFGCGRLRPRGGDRHCGKAWLLKAAEMWLKKLGSAAGGLAARGKGCSVGRGAGEAKSRGVGSALGGLSSGWALSGAGLEVFPAVGGGQNGSASPPPGYADPTLEALPWSVTRSGLGRFGDPGLPGPRASGLKNE